MMLRVCLAVLLCCCWSVSFAWNWVGHELVAQIAYDNLTLNAKHKVNFLVKYFSKEYPYYKSFVKMAPWPDSLHKQNIEIYNHWHYINLLFVDEKMSSQGLTNTDNVVRAITVITPIVENPHANFYERARFLSFLAHFVGDIHQPLHAVSRITLKHPDGDKGGNLFIVKDGADDHANLHKVWDDGCNLFLLKHQNQVVALSKKIEKTYPETYFGNAVNDLSPDHWAQESFKLAKSVVYKTSENKNLSKEYISKGQQLAEQRIALAGYRLAKLLNKILDI